MNNIKYWRDYHGFSQRWLAMKIGISNVEMSYIESEKRIPNVRIAIKLAKVLKQPVEELFPDDGK